MPTDKPEMPHTQTSAPTAPARTTEDVPGTSRQAGSEETSRESSLESEHEREYHMPKGADEPGAGL
jgi:hypothetical protein